MAKELFNSDFYTLPEQVQINKDDIKTNTANIQRLGDLSDTYHDQIQSLNTKVATNTTNIDSIKQSYLLKSDASNIYATKSAIKSFEYDYFDADLTTAGFAKIQANPTIGTSITLFKDTDFTEVMFNISQEHKTVIFNLYKDDDEDVYISTNIKLDIGHTTSYYSDNDQPCIWYTGIGVIKLGTDADFGNNYLCYIAYNVSYNNGLTITPIKKLN